MYAYKRYSESLFSDPDLTEGPPPDYVIGNPGHSQFLGASELTFSLSEVKRFKDEDDARCYAIKHRTIGFKMKSPNLCEPPSQPLRMDPWRPSCSILQNGLVVDIPTLSTLDPKIVRELMGVEISDEAASVLTDAYIRVGGLTTLVLLRAMR